jgi:L-arabinose isomerase
MIKRPCIGLLNLYLSLYDERLPSLRDGFDGYPKRVAAGFESRGVDVQLAPIACVDCDVRKAIAEFEAAGVDLIVTLHLAYSPSLESADAFCATSLPLLLLSTSMDANFGMDVEPERLLYNHGIHGVMDLASVLRRRGRAYEIIAGHDILDRAADHARAALAACELRNTRALRVGPTFSGMGDFQVDESLLGIRTESIDIAALDRAVCEISDEAVEREMASDREHYECALSEITHERAVRVGLGLRAILEQGGFSAFSVNFQAFDRADRPACTMPFLEIAKAMGRGIGYAGEGDLLSAALVGALARTFGAVTFTEIFCADWKGDSLFLSHMGEISPSVAAATPRVLEKPSAFIDGHPPAVLTSGIKPGPAVLVNLAPGPDDSFSLILAPVNVLPEDGLHPEMADAIRAWIRPRCGEREGDLRGVRTFLEAYSRAGGTHHQALVLGEHAEALAAFGRMAGCDVVTL